MAAPIRKYDITTSTERNGKKFYRTIGEIAVWQGDQGERLSLELFAQPDTNFGVFEQKPRESRALDTHNDDGVNIANIPF